jgi:hypothetical protein
LQPKAIALSQNRSDNTVMTQDEIWHQLLKLVEESVPKRDVNHQPQVLWQRPNRLVQLGRWQVQARFVAESGKYSIYFERYGADIGDQNFELPPGAGTPKRTARTMILEVSDGEPFWRFSDGQTLDSADLARRVLARLSDFEQEYGLSVIAPGY